ncbi:hypothetical protein BWQ96_00570 [Gracilariopsis chorda]|uniref:Uncharacterized protein n=1 Tax=Gracilariopsis chorda TaxID=448386 RepID=A0A2V3J6D8_9FLOR|nr:hypothetical protein BWQ96_00570 [Gracilariopsis chorda]|eukprot:PXF49692.1 hypothetical protein BWQ96_00570 [Gracilariopsis chorda]
MERQSHWNRTKPEAQSPSRVSTFVSSRYRKIAPSISVDPGVAAKESPDVPVRSLPVEGSATAQAEVPNATPTKRSTARSKGSDAGSPEGLRGFSSER